MQRLCNAELGGGINELILTSTPGGQKGRGGGRARTVSVHKTPQLICARTTSLIRCCSTFLRELTSSTTPPPQPPSRSQGWRQAAAVCANGAETNYTFKHRRRSSSSSQMAVKLPHRGRLVPGALGGFHRSTTAPNRAARSAVTCASNYGARVAQTSGSAKSTNYLSGRSASISRPKEGRFMEDNRGGAFPSAPAETWSEPRCCPPLFSPCPPRAPPSGANCPLV